MLLANGDRAGAEELNAKLEEIGAAVADVEAREANIRAGYVYVISNIGAFGENVVKLGMTRRPEPGGRVRELGDASVPFEFDTHALIFSEDAVSLESRLHDELRERRVNKANARREFFYATPAEVRDLLEKIAGQRLLEYRDVPEALNGGSGPTALRPQSEARRAGVSRRAGEQDIRNVPLPLHPAGCGGGHS
ncbi:GIY-YIG nuclease family protein [Microbispora sp. NPDC046933]|uniref:GIY-YIG nuclease family protein n=1 Tax=Microbispora sp. NPDC046933 TaxID=3155618 RepID=UPI00340D492D